MCDGVTTVRDMAARLLLVHHDDSETYDVDTSSLSNIAELKSLVAIYHLETIA